MICEVAELDERNRVVNITVMDTDNFGIKDTYGETNVAMRAWFAKNMKHLNAEKLVLLFSRENANIGDVYEPDSTRVVRFIEDFDAAQGFPENIGFWDEEYGRWFVYLNDARTDSNKRLFERDWRVFKNKVDTERWN